MRKIQTHYWAAWPKVELDRRGPQVNPTNVSSKSSYLLFVIILTYITTLYELLPAGANTIPAVDPLKYQMISQPADTSDEVLTVKLRYKPLNTNESFLLTRAVTDNNNTLAATSDDFRFAASVAGFGMLLRHSSHVKQLTYSQLITMARRSRGTDEEGYRAEFIHLLEMSELLHDK